jgi:hypothetical protein
MESTVERFAPAMQDAPLMSIEKGSLPYTGGGKANMDKTARKGVSHYVDGRSHFVVESYFGTAALHSVLVDALISEKRQKERIANPALQAYNKSCNTAAVASTEEDEG